MSGPWCQLSPTSSKHSHGYTLIEVMMAVGIMTVGSVAILSLQQASTRGNNEARQITAATQATRTWLERVRRDAVRWTSPGLAGVAAGPIYLSNTPAPPGVSGWLSPPTDPMTGDSNAFDYQGNDTDNPDEMVYCTHLQFQWLIPGQSIRVDARTFWHKRGRGVGDGVSDQRLFRNCARGAEDTVTAELNRVPSRLHSVSASTVVRWSQLQ